METTKLQNSYEHYDFFDKKYSIKEVLDFYNTGVISLEEQEGLSKNEIKKLVKKTIEKNYDGNLVKMNSQRYQTFKDKGCICSECGREGTYFKLQRNHGRKGKEATGRYHFGLWSEDKVQMTKDHIIPKSLGGTNSIENYITMCEICNVNKGNSCSEEDIKNGKHLEGFNPKPQENIGGKSNDNINNDNVKIFSKRLKKEDTKYQEYITFINEYMKEYNTNPYIVDKSTLPSELVEKIDYIIDFFTKIIIFAKGNLSPKNKALTGLPKSISAKIINDVQNQENF